MLTIASPIEGATVATAVVVVEGAAPGGAVVVRDVSLAPDETVIAASDGTWKMEIELKEGLNQLTFRLGDDKATAKTLSVTFVPQVTEVTSTPTLSVTPTATPTPLATPTEEPSLEATPTLEPTAEPSPEPTFASFTDGTWEVGVDIASGTYRIQEPAEFCYWARLKGFEGTLDEIIANENAVFAYAVVTIGKNDAGFTSSGCGEWTKDLSQVTADTSLILLDGTYIVGKDMKAGKWRSPGGDLCYWSRLQGFGGTLGSIIANGIAEGPVIVTIKSTDKGFKSSGCNLWERQ